MEDDVRAHSVFKRLLGVERTVIEDVMIEGQALVVHARVWARERYRCTHCGRRCARYDRGRGRRRWRALGFGSTPVYLEADPLARAVPAAWGGDRALPVGEVG